MDTPVTRPPPLVTRKATPEPFPPIHHPPTVHSASTPQVFSAFFFLLPCLLRPFAHSGTEGSGMGWAGEQRTCAFAANSCLPCFFVVRQYSNCASWQGWNLHRVPPPPVTLSTYKPRFYLHTHTHIKVLCMQWWEIKYSRYTHPHTGQSLSDSNRVMLLFFPLLQCSPNANERAGMAIASMMQGCNASPISRKHDDPHKTICN